MRQDTVVEVSGAVVGLYVAPKNRYIEVLIPSTYECDVVWK